MKINKILVGLLLIFLSISCEKLEKEVVVQTIETPDWTELTHSNSVNPDYTVVFPQNKVQRIDITISSDDWEAIMDDLADMPMTGPGQSLDNIIEPIWVSCDFIFNGLHWYKVGIRVKGNSSLMTTYRSGIKKFSFKLDFDEFEDTYPAIKNQRFYGFKQLNLNNGFEDYSLMREKIVSDLFRSFGIPSSHSSFCEVYINNNGQSQYFGLYTIVEEVDNTVIKTQFTSDAGNLYKPEGDAASFASGTYNTDEFYKKTNEENNDWSDISSLYNALNSTLRNIDRAAWRVQLESTINMELFLKWLAANTVIQNWDTYGLMTHNYYLYNDPLTAKLVWIPWDNNEALQDGKMGGAVELDLSDVSSQWPLIKYIADDDYYFSLYKQYVSEFTTTHFTSAKMYETYDFYSVLIKEYVLKEEYGYTFLSSENDFDNAILQLKQHVNQRNAEVVLLK